MLLSTSVPCFEEELYYHFCVVFLKKLLEECSAEGIGSLQDINHHLGDMADSLIVEASQQDFESCLLANL
jgi:hypothetical protein